MFESAEQEIVQYRAEHRLIKPRDAHTKMAEGYVCLDVRLEEEYEAAHPPGAYNVPFAFDDLEIHLNPDFVTVVARTFPKRAKLIVMCRGTQSRSEAARKALVAAGFEDVSTMDPNWDRESRLMGDWQKGWVDSGLPSEAGAPPGRAYASLMTSPR
jgi:rhodanese-related sulfurtransferase